MAYLITNLRKKKKGEVIRVSSNKKEYSIKLINKYQFNEEYIDNIEVNNYSVNILIPETGYWKLKCVSKKQLTNYYFDLKISISS